MLSREAHELLSELRSAFVAAGPEKWVKAGWGPCGVIDEAPPGVNRVGCLISFARSVARNANLTDADLELDAYLADRIRPDRRGIAVTVIAQFNDHRDTSWDDVVRLLDAALYESVCEQRAAGRYPASAPRRWERAR